MSDKEYLKVALEQAKLSVEQGGFPAGAIIVKDNEIISRGISISFKLNDPTAHAETVAVKEACKKLGTSTIEGATLYASLQPCLMCFSGANWAGVSRVVYGTRRTKEMIEKQYYEGNTDIEDVNKNNIRKVKLEFIPDYEKESLELINKWENQI